MHLYHCQWQRKRMPILCKGICSLHLIFKLIDKIIKEEAAAVASYIRIRISRHYCREHRVNSTLQQSTIEQCIDTVVILLYPLVLRSFVLNRKVKIIPQYISLQILSVCLFNADHPSPCTLLSRTSDAILSHVQLLFFSFGVLFHEGSTDFTVLIILFG